METPAPPTTPIKPFQTRQLILLGTLAGLGHLNRVAISVAGNEWLIPEVGFTEIQMGWVYTAFYLTYTLFMLPCGTSIDRWGPARALSAFGLLSGLSVLGMGLAGWGRTLPATLLGWLIGLRLLAGVVGTPLHPAAASALTAIQDAGQRIRANGIISASALTGVALAYPIFGLLMDHLGWAVALMICGLSLSLAGLAWWFQNRSRPGDAPEKAHASDTKQNQEQHERKPEGPAHQQLNLSALLRNRALLLLGLSYGTFCYFQYLAFFWGNRYLSEILQVPATSARWLTAAMMAAHGIGMIAGGYLIPSSSEKGTSSSGRARLAMISLVGAAIVGLIAMALHQPIAVITLLSLSLGALGLSEGIFWTQAADYGGAASGRSAAIMNTWGNLGGLIAPVTAAWLASHFGWSVSIAFACLLLLTGAAAWALIGRIAQNPQAGEYRAR